MASYRLLPQWLPSSIGLGANARGQSHAESRQTGLSGRPKPRTSTWLLALFGVLTACASNDCKKDCRTTKGSPDEPDKPAAATTTQADSSSLNESNNSVDTGTMGRQRYTCRRDEDCVATPFPACSLLLRQCVDCTSDAHCSERAPHCAIRPSDAQNHCVECQTGADCASGVCQNDSCLTCNPDTNEGCNEGVCLGSDVGAPRCVECQVDEHCSTGSCIDNRCIICDVNTGVGCANGEVCLSRSELVTNEGVENAPDAGAIANDGTFALDETMSAGGVCVECAPNLPCSAPNRPVCLRNTCVACDPDAPDNNGCTPSAPLCLRATNGETAADDTKATIRCVECLQSADCRGAYCVDNRCQPCDPISDDGCNNGNICTRRANADPAAPITYSCAQCSSDKPCAEGLHCGADGQCHECLVSAHCPESKPVCQAGGSCGGCTSNSQCSAPKPYCGTDGQCVACEKDEHCAPETPVCFTETHSCVQCTEDNLDACKGNPCHLPGGPKAYTCYEEDDEAGGDR